MGLKYLLVCLVLVLGVGFADPVLAVSPSSILVDVSPQNPSPNSNVNISLRSYAANLDSVQINWFINDKSALSGVGKKSLSLTIGDSGTTTTVRARILLPDGQIEKTVVLKPSSMILLWQASDSYVPPFYKGKALPVSDSKIKVVAMPEIKTSANTSVNPKNMNYVWKKDLNNQPNESGYGKNFFIYSGSFLDSSNSISAIATTGDQKSQAEGQINITPTNPEIVFYKNDTSMGVLLDQALSNQYQIQGEETLAAIPYFISPKEIGRPELIWNWYINGILVENKNSKSNMIPLQVAGDSSGISTLKLEIENSYKIFQTAKKEISIQF